MTRAELLVLFCEIFRVKNEIEDWFPNGKNSIRIRFKEKTMLPFAIDKSKELIFTAESRDDWRLETVDSWVRTMSKLIKEKE